MYLHVGVKLWAEGLFFLTYIVIEKENVILVLCVHGRLYKRWDMFINVLKKELLYNSKDMVIFKKKKIVISIIVY